MTSASDPVGPSGASSPRLVVLQVTEEDDGGNNFKRVRFLETRRNVELNVNLRGDWVRTNIQPTHVARVILVSKDGSYTRWRTSNFKTSSMQASTSSVITIDDISNLLILHPDTLVSGTTVSESFRCIRKSILTTRTPPAVIGEAALFGSMIHDLFQTVLVLDSNTRDYSTIEELSQVGGVDIMSIFEAVEDIVNGHSEELFAVKISISHARKVLHKVVPQIVQWYQLFTGSGNYHNTEGSLVPFGGKSLCNVIVTKVHDIEELVWSPVLGLKGKIDSSVHLRVNGEDVGIGVLELKTGKAVGYSSVSHSAQVSLYKLLLSDRKGSLVTHGLLTYIPYKKALQAVNEDEEKQVFNMQLTNHNGTQNLNANGMNPKTASSKTDDDMSHRLVATVHSELIALIMQRNEVAGYLRTDVDIEDLPPVLIGQKDVCERCFATDSCMIQHKLLENGTEETVRDGPGIEMFQKKAGHLTKEHANYFSFWKNVLADEEEYAGRYLRLLWSMSGQQREAIGKCASNLLLIVKEANDFEGEGDAKSEVEEETGTIPNVSPHGLLGPGSRTIAEFQRFRYDHHNVVHQEEKQKSYKPLLQCGFSAGDYVLVSAERRRRHSPNQNQDEKTAKGSQSEFEGCETWQSALTNGFVQKVTKDSIFVSVDRSLAAWSIHQDVEIKDVAWRIDGEETAASHNIAKRTLQTLFSSEMTTPGVTRRRQLIVDGATPIFSPTRPSIKVGIAPGRNGVKENGLGESMELNDEQKRALDLSFRARDYLLILGMPGTGKTATLSSIVMVHARMGKSILLCSHTNTAVDNLLRRLLSMGFDDFIRLGRNKNVVDEKIHPYHVSAIVERASDTNGSGWDKIDKEICKKRVVATTCLGIGHWVLQVRKKFDLVVVDEASQMMQPICIGPLLSTDQGGAFILVGDHYQLPPLQRAGVGIGRRLTRMERETKEGKIGDSKDIRQKCEESLFRRLCVRHPEAIVLLSKQYRMAGEIMDLCNKTVYGGSLKCGSEVVKNQRIQTNWSGQSSNSNQNNGIASSSWIEYVRNPEHQVIFIDTQQKTKVQRHLDAAKHEKGKEKELENQEEAKIIQQSALHLVQDGMTAKDITILSPYRAQVDLLKSIMRMEESTKECEVSTVDQYQGKDNECIILSFVRHGDIGVGHLLKDWRRINVAMTRAKCKLILVGCASSLSCGTHFLKLMVQHLRSKRAIIAAR